MSESYIALSISFIDEFSAGTCHFMIGPALNMDYLSILKLTVKVVVTCRSTASLNEFSIGYCVKIILELRLDGKQFLLITEWRDSLIFSHISVDNILLDNIIID